MLHADRRKALKLGLVAIALQILVAQAHRVGPLERLDHAGHRDTALVMAHQGAGNRQYLRICKIAASAECRQIEHHKPLGHPDMRRGDADPRGGPHGVKKVVGERLQRRVESDHGTCDPGQAGIGKGEDGALHAVGDLRSNRICDSGEKAEKQYAYNRARRRRPLDLPPGIG